MNITFSKANSIHEPIIFEWLKKPHVKEFWDNSQKHRNDISHFIHGVKERPYANGMFDYWVGAMDDEPFCLVMTSEVLHASEPWSSYWNPHLSKTGRTYSFDFMIGNENYFGKGLAAPTLQAFAKFLQEQVDPTIDTFMIDPNVNNPRAKHVYQKAGFIPVAEFERRGEQFILMVMNL